jgi:salicylate hydroxylase
MSNISVTYPTQSLRFLEGLELDDKTTGKTTHGLTVPESASLKLKVVVVGAGIGGLACAVALARRGHSVRILEQAPKLAAVSRTR